MLAVPCIKLDRFQYVTKFTSGPLIFSGCVILWMKYLDKSCIMTRQSHESHYSIFPNECLKLLHFPEGGRVLACIREPFRGNSFLVSKRTEGKKR